MGIQNALNKQDWEIMADEILGLEEVIKRIEKEVLDLSKSNKPHEDPHAELTDNEKNRVIEKALIETSSKKLAPRAGFEQTT